LPVALFKSIVFGFQGFFFRSKAIYLNPASVILKIQMEIHLNQYLAVLIFILFFSASAFSVLEQDSMKVFAVTTKGNAMSADLSLELVDGTGRVFTTVDPLVGTSTQTTQRIAVDVAKKYYPVAASYDYKFSIQSTASLVDGPSAGGAMGLLVVSMLDGRGVPENVSMTGTINSDGSIGSVAGIFEKTKEAANQGIELFMIPFGEAKQTVKLSTGIESIDLVEYASREWGMKVVEVNNIDDVLEYAFSDIASIDVNRQEPIIPDFVPSPISFSKSLKPMKLLTLKYVEEARASIDSAHQSLQGTMLDEHSVVDLMLASLDESEKLLKKAEILYDTNHLYSAANYAFLSKVYSSLVIDISDNPSLISVDSTIFDLKVNSLANEINRLEQELEQSIPVNCIEWHASAKQRLNYADVTVAELRSIRTIIGAQEIEQAVSGVLDYEYAVAWVQIAEDLYSITREEQCSLSTVHDTSFAKELAEKELVSLENLIEISEVDEESDIMRRFLSAKVAQSKGWFMAAAFDAVSAKALIEAESSYLDKDYVSLEQELRNGIQKTDSEIVSFDSDSVWASLYLDHARYYYDSALFYNGHGRLSLALDNLRSGMSLLSLAINVNSVSSSFKETISKIPEEELFVSSPVSEPFRGEGDQETSEEIKFLIGIIAVLLVVLAITILKVFSIPNHPSRIQQIRSVKKLQNDLEEAFAKKRISEEKYHELYNKYFHILSRLEKEASKKSIKVLELDALNAELSSSQQLLRDLKRRYNEGTITKEDYEKRLSAYTLLVEKVKHRIELDKKQIEKIDSK